MKNIKKKIKKALKINKKTNKVKNEPIKETVITLKRTKNVEPVLLKPKIKKDSLKKNDIETPSEEVVEPTDQQAQDKNQLDKRERIDLYKKSLTTKPAACNINEAFDLINKTLLEIEEKYGPGADNKSFYFSKKYGRMFPLPKDRLKYNPEIGKNEMITVGFTIYINKNGSFEFWSKHPTEPKLIFSKSGGTNHSFSEIITITPI